MRRPDTRVMLLGHPVVAGPLVIAGAVGVFAAWQSSNPIIVAASLGMMIAAGNAHERASAYKRWKTDWDAMGVPSVTCARPSRRVRLGALLATLLLAGLTLLVATDPHGSWIGAAIILAGLVLVVTMVRWIRRRIDEHRFRKALARPVYVVAKPILPIPTLDQAYARLPDYCQRVLKGPRR